MRQYNSIAMTELKDLKFFTRLEEGVAWSMDYAQNILIALEQAEQVSAG